MREQQLLMIPGPVNFDPAVLRAMARKTESHMGEPFARTFGRTLRALPEVLRAPGYLPLVVAGSGTLAMEMAVANLLRPGDGAVVSSAGSFGDRWAEIVESFGGRPVLLQSRAGEAPDPDQVAATLEEHRPRALFVTHVETSTGVKQDVAALGRLARAQGALFVVDAVCSAGGMLVDCAGWGIDVLVTGSQKALGVPPGLAVTLFGPSTLKVRQERTERPRAYYADLGRWRPIMEAFLEDRAAYFATPAVNLIYALDEALAQIREEGMEARAERHARLSRGFRAGGRAMGLEVVARTEAWASDTVTAFYYPDGTGPALLQEVAREGVVLAGGVHPEVGARTFRVGHMGGVSAGEVLATLGAIERGLARLGFGGADGRSVAAAQEGLGA